MAEQISDLRGAPKIESAPAATDRPARAGHGIPGQTSRPFLTRARIVQVISLVVLVVLLLVLWRFLGDRSAAPGAGRGGRAGAGEVVPVEVAVVSQQDVPIQIKSMGNVEAQNTIAVRSQVEGTLMQVGFAPGQEVKKGDLLFRIDPRPLQAQLSQAEANLLKSMAAVRQANDIVARDEATVANDRI